MDNLKPNQDPLYGYQIAPPFWLLAVFMLPFILLFLLILLYAFSNLFLALLGLAAVLTICFFLYENNRRRLAGRPAAILERRREKFDRSAIKDFQSYISQAVFNEEFSKRNHSLKRRPTEINLQVQPFDDQALIGRVKLSKKNKQKSLNYQFYDVVATVKNHRYDQSKYYYTILEMKLCKKVPRLIFDSKLAKKTQFKSVYAKEQKVQMDEDFDAFFNVYSPHHCSAQVLTFLTPAIKDNMIYLDRYDFELIGDSLLCYAPLLDERQLIYFRENCFRLQAALDQSLSSVRFDKSQIQTFGKQTSNKLQKQFWTAAVSMLGFLSSYFIFPRIFDVDTFRIQWQITVVVSLASLVLTIGLIFRRFIHNEKIKKRVEAQFEQRKANSEL